MIRKFGCLLCMMCVAVAMGLKVNGAEMAGRLQVIPEWCGKPVTGGSIFVTHVGYMTENGIILSDGLANWRTDVQELQSEAWISWLLQHTAGKEQSAQIREESGAVFEMLSEGIYLVEPRGISGEYIPFQPFLQTIPDNGRWDIVLHPSMIRAGESPRTADRPAPIVAGMGLGLSAAILMVLADSRKK